MRICKIHFDFITFHVFEGVRRFVAAAEARSNNVFVERVWRSVKREEVYLKAYESGRQPHPALHRRLRRVVQPETASFEPGGSGADEADFATLPALQSTA